MDRAEIGAHTLESMTWYDSPYAWSVKRVVDAARKLGPQNLKLRAELRRSKKIASRLYFEVVMLRAAVEELGHVSEDMRRRSAAILETAEKQATLRRR